MSIQKFKTQVEMDAVRRQIEQQPIQRPEPEPNETKSLAVFEVFRYVKGSFVGMFKVVQLFSEDGEGRPMKRPTLKVISDGNFIDIAMSDLETTIRRRVFR